MNMTVTAIAEMSGQGSARRSARERRAPRHDGGQQQLAIVDPQAVDDRQLSPASHSGVRLSTTGMCAKL
jgi:hypothetical protein